MRTLHRQSRRQAAALTGGFAERRREAAARGRLRGLGIGCFLETARGAADEGAEIRFESDGRVALVLGTQSNGQGHETSFPQIAASLLGLPLEAFRYVQADTQTVEGVRDMVARARCIRAARRW